MSLQRHRGELAPVNRPRRASALIDRLNRGQWWSYPTWERAVLRAAASGFSAAEVAEELDCSVDAVSQVLSRRRRAG